MPACIIALVLGWNGRKCWEFQQIWHQETRGPSIRFMIYRHMTNDFLLCVSGYPWSHHNWRIDERRSEDSSWGVKSGSMQFIYIVHLGVFFLISACFILWRKSHCWLQQNTASCLGALMNCCLFMKVNYCIWKSAEFESCSDGKRENTWILMVPWTPLLL